MSVMYFVQQQLLMFSDASYPQPQHAKRLKREPCEMDTIAWSLRENFCYTDQTLEVFDDLNKMSRLQPPR